MKDLALILTGLLLHLSDTTAIRVFSGSALSQLGQSAGNSTESVNRRSWTAPEPGLYKVKLTQRGYIQFLRYMVNVPPLQQYTFCLWLNSNNFTYNHPLFSYSRDEKESMVKVWLSPSDKSLKITVKDQPVLKVGLQLREGRWYHICQSWSGVTGEWNVFLDGVLKKTEKYPRHVGVMLPGGGDIAVGQELTDFNKGLDDGVEGEIFGFNMVDEAVDLKTMSGLSVGQGINLRADNIKLPTSSSQVPDFKKMPINSQKTFEEINGFISKLPKEPLPVSTRMEKLRIGELPASSQPRRPTGRARTNSQAVVFRNDQEDSRPNRRPQPARDAKVQARPSPIKVDDLNSIPNSPRPKINQEFDINYNMHAYKVPKRTGKPSDYKTSERNDDDDDYLERRIDTGSRGEDVKKRKRQNFDVVSAWEVNRAHPFYLPKIYDERHRTHYHFETAAQTPISRRTFIVDDKPVKIVSKTRGSLPATIPVVEIVDEGFRRRRRRDTRRRESRQSPGEFRPMPGLPEEFSELLNPTISNDAIVERLNAFVKNRSSNKSQGTPLLSRRAPQNFLPVDDVLLIEHNVHVPEVSQALVEKPESRISLPSQMGSAGNELVRRSLTECAEERGSPMSDVRHVLVSWADTPVRIYGGAVISTATTKCAHF